MPNYCYFKMRIKGKKEDATKLVAWLNADYNYYFDENKCDECSEEHHFYRVFDLRPDNDSLTLKEDDSTINLSGTCAWSVYACMFPGDKTYYDDYNKKHKFATTMDKASKELNLDVEIFSYESGCGFMEHYIIKKGDIVFNKCISYNDLDIYIDSNEIDVTDEALKKYYNGNIKNTCEYWDMFEKKLIDKYFKFNI